MLAALLAFVLSILFKLTNLLDVFQFAIDNMNQMIAAVIAFWTPILYSSVAMFVLIYPITRLIWTGPDDVENESDSITFDQLDPRSQDSDTLSAALTQSQSVLDNQLETLTDIDDKALRTVRVQVILLGAIASAAQIASKTVPVNVWMKIGGVLLIGSIVAGIFTYTVSDGRAGPRPEKVSRILASRSSKSHVYLRLLEAQRDAISDNREILADNGRYIFYTQLLLVLGILSGGIGVLLALMG